MLPVSLDCPFLIDPSVVSNVYLSGVTYVASVSRLSLLKMGKLYKLSVKIQLDLFDKMITHILLYGCEVWGFGKNEVLERVHLKFCKILLNLKLSTPKYMVYGELGRYPIDIDLTNNDS